MNDKNSNEDRIVQLVEIYNNGENFDVSDKEQIRLLLILFSWILTSSNRRLRDITSKAMIEILKENFEYAEYLLKLFSDVNDPYVIQRLYGIVFGACVKRSDENKEIFKSLSCFVFENIFNKEIVFPDILLRDYARLIVDRYLMEYPGELQDYNLEKIRPPYQSPDIPDLTDQKYEDQNFQNGLWEIQHSMMFDGIGMYGDFGRYVFQGALRYFNVDDYKIFNYAMYHIIHELGYQGELFDTYDRYERSLSYDRHRVIKVERIGKKYQWIAMYNILARVSDYYPMKERYSEEESSAAYDGPWNPYVRDFDPTLNEHNLFCEEAPYFPVVEAHIKEAIQENNRNKDDRAFDEKAWVRSDTVFFQYQKEDLILIDEDENQWVVLSKYTDTGKYDLAYDKLLMWNWLYGYFITDEQLDGLRNFAGEKANFHISDIAGIPETYTLFNREYPWSSGSRTELKWQWKDIELRTDEPGEEPVMKELGKALNATQDLLWEEEFDASKEEAISCSHPCAEIINVLGLRQKKYDGYYYDASGVLTAFDTSLTKQKAGLIIRKTALDKFLDIKKLHLVWVVNASKEIHDETLMITKFADWTGLLEYMGDSVQGEYYVAEEE